MSRTTKTHVKASNTRICSRFFPLDSISSHNIFLAYDVKSIHFGKHILTFCGLDITLILL